MLDTRGPSTGTIGVLFPHSPRDTQLGLGQIRWSIQLLSAVRKGAGHSHGAFLPGLGIRGVIGHGSPMAGL